MITTKAGVEKCLELIGKPSISEVGNTVIAQVSLVRDNLYGLMIVDALLPAFTLEPQRGSGGDSPQREEMIQYCITKSVPMY